MADWNTTQGSAQTWCLIPQLPSHCIIGVTRIMMAGHVKGVWFVCCTCCLAFLCCLPLLLPAWHMAALLAQRHADLTTLLCETSKPVAHDCSWRTTAALSA